MSLSVLKPGDPVSVGKYYRVRLATAHFYDGRTFTMPVIGEPHIDNQFGFPHEHIHIDGRFTPGVLGDFDTDSNGRTNVILVTKVVGEYHGIMPSKVEFTTGIRKCKRLTTGLELGWYSPQTGQQSVSTKYLKWYHGFIGRPCRGKKCPHLGEVMHDVGDGRMRCPLHDIWADKNGKVIPHPSFIKEFEKLDYIKQHAG